MEYVPGASLDKYLKALHKREEKLPLEKVRQILSLLAGAIDYAHSQKIIHRDIKPANVLLRSAGGPVETELPLPEDVEPVLTDFGLVRLLDSSAHTTTGAVSGTPAYMSPEQARGDEVTSKTDIYSLTVMLYEMLAGTVPFEAESSFAVLMKHLNEPPPSIPGISADLQLIIDRGLAKKPEVRYGTARELADEFSAVLKGQPVSAETRRLLKASQKTIEKTEKRNRTFPWIWAGAGAFLLIVLAIGAFGFWGGNPLKKNQPVGRIAFLDSYYVMDKVTVTVSDLPLPKTGTHYEVWLAGGAGKTFRSIGTVKIDKAGQGQLSFTEPDQNNILSIFDRVEITLEKDNDPKPEIPSTEVAASSVSPPLALIHVRDVTSEFSNAPYATALIQGLWSTSESLYTSTDELNTAFVNNDETLFRLKLEEIINQLAGNANTNQYKDWNQDGTLNDPSDGFGLLYNGNPGITDQGYIAQTLSHASLAARAADATEDIKLNGTHIVTCGENMKTWAEKFLEKAIQLQNLPFSVEMKPLVEELTSLSTNIISGVDSNGNGVIEPITGEGGAGTAYENAYFMAEMPLLPGMDRIPAPASGVNK